MQCPIRLEFRQAASSEINFVASRVLSMDWSPSSNNGKTQAHSLPSHRANLTPASGWLKQLCHFKQQEICSQGLHWEAPRPLRVLDTPGVPLRVFSLITPSQTRPFSCSSTDVSGAVCKIALAAEPQHQGNTDETAQDGLMQSRQRP